MLDQFLNLRVGNGYDIHKLETGRRFILGGIDIPNEKGFVAHSDGDVLIHSIIDALLGAAGMGNIGLLYPDTDQKYKNADSTVLLKDTINRISSEGFIIINIDTSVICQKPKLSPYIDQIGQSLSILTGLDAGLISIKPRTKEGIDGTGEERSVEVYSTVLLFKNNLK